ncbi:MAG TPA: hypothetical protein VGJ91_00435 [Polyangiaceae bacterium]
MLGMRLQDFTAVFGAKDAVRLAALLEQDDRAQPYRNVYGLHELRWALFDANQRSDVSGIDSARPQALVLSLVFDGNRTDILEAVVDQAGAQIREILSFCYGFDAQTDVLGFLKAHATPSGYLFRDLGPLLIPSESDPKLEPDPEPDPTRAEIEDAYAMQRRFERFYAAHSRDPARELREAYLREFADDAFPLGLTPFERRSNDEESWTRRMIDDARKQQDKAARSSNDRLIRRGVHAKAHGLLHAKFQVLESACPLGLFAEPRAYQAILRPSNGDPKLKNDRGFDARGLALGVFVPSSASDAAGTPDFVLPTEGGNPARQDFVLMNRPTFFAANIRRLGMWSKTLHGERPAAKVLGVAGLLCGPNGLREGLTFVRVIASKLRHPLAAEFHSTTPYLLGDHQVAKYSVRPRDPARFHALSRYNGSDALSKALKDSLRDRPIVLEFYVHVFRRGWPNGGSTLVDVVEDATLDWDALGAEKVHVANIEIGPQDPTTIERMNQAEFARFDPWNALRQHRPLGSLNRARYAAYRASQRYRSVELAHSSEATIVTKAAE